MIGTPLRFLVDVGVGKKVENHLVELGHDVATVRSIDPHMPDINIIQIATSEQRIVLTMDKDFGELVYHSKLAHHGVLLLRLEDAKGDEKVLVIDDIKKNYGDQIFNSFSVYQNNRLRVRKL